ncbi:MAG TPA: response regulator, partial [Chitinivibrionales bacterium]
IEEKTRLKLFEPFFTTKPPGKGTGLGLANVVRVMKNHKGFVDVASVPGGGSTFNLYLPITVIDTPAKHDENNEESLQVVPVYVNARILVIDNDPAVCEILMLALQNAGCTVTSNVNPLSAVEAYRKHWEEFDVVLIDMLMPQCNGFECLRRFKEINPSVKAILVSGLNELIEDHRITEMGFAGSITKPFNIRTLISTVARASKS